MKGITSKKKQKKPRMTSESVWKPDPDMSSNTPNQSWKKKI